MKTETQIEEIKLRVQKARAAAGTAAAGHDAARAADAAALRNR